MSYLSHAPRSSRSQQRSRVTQSAVLAALIVTVVALSSCKIRLIGDYDDVIDQGVTNIQQKADLYFTKLLSTPTTPYDQSFYDDIDSRLTVLKTRASLLPKYPIITQQLTNLRSQFDQLQQLDKTATRPISAAIVNDSQSAITVSIESILKLEIALKRGVATAPSK